MPGISSEQEAALASFLAGAETLEKAIDGLTEEDLDKNLVPGEWSIRQIVHHVTEDGEFWSTIFKKAIANPGTKIRFEGNLENEAWANALAFELRPIANSLALIKAHRKVFIEIAKQFPDKWENTINILDDKGEVAATVGAGQIIGFLSAHMEEHLKTIDEIKNKHGIG